MGCRTNTNRYGSVGYVLGFFGLCLTRSLIDTGLSEMLVPLTRTEGFNKALEIQQSTCTLRHEILTINCVIYPSDLLSSYEVSTQVSAIEDLIAQGESMQMILRLACLASLVNGGIKAKSLDNIKREILQVCWIFYLYLRATKAHPVVRIRKLISLVVIDLCPPRPPCIKPSTAHSTFLRCLEATLCFIEKVAETGSRGCGGSGRTRRYQLCLFWIRTP